ncbi:MAG: S-layer homology domain-containing protein [Clostridia bacterium]|nr:S-layer homology domain-containing protein [Clostridia bacterium]
MLKRVISMLLILVLMASTFVYAEGEENTENQGKVFSDVNEGDWFYTAVMTMSEYGIISGYPDGTFKPNNPVLREEFAVMMVKALKLDIKEPSNTFIDVAEGYWANKWIETAMPYLTGWSRNGDVVFKPQDHAVREDMAVALVKALNKPLDDSMSYVLDSFEDKNEISSNLRNHMASAVYNNLMSGYEIDGLKYLKPMDTLTRAQAAALLMSVIKEEKIVFDDEKIVLSEGEFNLDYTTIDGGVSLTWDYETEQTVSGYKVVASKSDITPVYPENGYAKYVQTKEAKIYNYDSYNSGDFLKFEPGETYYISITALVSDDKVSSNTIEVTMPAAVNEEGMEAVLTATAIDDGFKLNWSEINMSGLQGYKVVASRSDSTPMYPDNGYAKWITDLSNRSAEIKVGTYYSSGDMEGGFKAGETYYVAITAVYNSGKVSSNVIQLTMPGELEEPATVAEKTPVVNVVVVDNHLEVTWNNISTDGLQGYKVVASKSDDSPKYPENGYAYWITNLSTHKAEIYPYTQYNGGDFERFISGETYHISVTAVYSDQKIAGNTVTVVMPN